MPRLLTAPILTAVLLAGGPCPAHAQAADLSRASAPAVPRLEISDVVAARVARQVWLNETGGRPDGITTWNTAEGFPSLGIGHFIWYPAGFRDRFGESFPPMIEFLRANGHRLPAWLDQSPIPPSPWRSKAEFEREFHSPRMVELRQFLHRTAGGQTQYLVQRMQASLPKMLATLPSPDDRRHVERQFARVVRASPDLYPLIDYINFKGEGINPTETYPSRSTGEPEGWGLKHLLIEMKGSEEGRVALAEFADAARYVLKRRIANNPPNRIWETGWMRRCETYRRPL